jgi:hypothetical protein
MILKKLAHDSELDEFDSNEIECKHGCLRKFYEENPTEFESGISVEILKRASTNLEIESFSCINERLTRLLMKNYIEHDFSANSRNHSVAMNILLSTLRINSEPIVLQVHCFITVYLK